MVEKGMNQLYEMNIQEEREKEMLFLLTAYLYCTVGIHSTVHKAYQGRRIAGEFSPAEAEALGDHPDHVYLFWSIFHSIPFHRYCTYLP